MKVQKIYPCFWFNGNAKEAAAFYCIAFGGEIVAENQAVSTIEIARQRLMCLNGHGNFKPNPSISIFTMCETMQEIDFAWTKLSEGGKVLVPVGDTPWSEKYGWVEDKFGVNWQLALGKIADVGQKFSPTLMFAGNKSGKSEEAIHYYTSVFKNSSITGILKYEDGEEDQKGLVKHGQFRIENYVMMAMDSSFPHGFDFDEGVSMVIECDDQETIDYYWDQLSAVPESEQCGWLKDKYGVSWQIIPSVLQELVTDPDKSEAVVMAFMQMKKFDIAALIEAANQQKSKK